MKNQLSDLKEKKNFLYLIIGNEYILIKDSVFKIYNDIKKEKIDIRHELHHINCENDWLVFIHNLYNKSIFIDHILFEVFIQKKLTENEEKSLKNYIKKPSKDNTLIIISNTTYAPKQNTSLFNLINNNGIILQIWKMRSQQIIIWIINRLKILGFNSNLQIAQLIANQTNEDLTKISQELEKLSILFPNEELTIEKINEVIIENNSYHLFDLLDAIIKNKILIIEEIITKLKYEYTDPSLILWLICDLIRSIIKMISSLKIGLNFDSIIKLHKGLIKYKTEIKKIINNNNVEIFYNYLQEAFKIELIIKGYDQNHIFWHELSKLYINFTKMIHYN